MNISMPEYLYHYYDARVGPFRTLSDLTVEEAENIQNRFRIENKQFAGKRSADYISIRRDLEAKARDLFISKGGKPVRRAPHYMTLGACPWLQEWYEQGQMLRIHISHFSTLSFTYGDLFPTMRYDDEKPYRKQIYTLAEIAEVIRRFGMPQDWNSDGMSGPERYIEAQVWDDESMRYARTIRNSNATSQA